MRPFAEIGFADDDRAGLAKPLHHESIVGRRRPDHSERTRSRLHPVGRIEIVFYHDGDAMQRPTLLPTGTLPVQFRGYLQSVGVDFNEGVKRRAIFVQRFDALEQVCHQPGRGQAACAHASLELDTGLKVNRLVFDDRTENRSIEVGVRLAGKCAGRYRERETETKLIVHDVLPWLIKRSS